MTYNTWACFDCRKVYNREHRKCPSCDNELHRMGKYFKAPTRKNDKEWEAIQILYQAGIRYNHGAVDLDFDLLAKYKNNPKQIPPYELITLLRTASWYYQALCQNHIVGERPKHPRTAREYLTTIETRKKELFWLVQTLVNRLGRSHPEAKKALARIHKDENPTC